MNCTTEELREFLATQANDFDNEMVDAEIGGHEYEYAYAFGAREAYRFVARWLEEYRAEEGFVEATIKGQNVKYLTDRYDWNIYCGDYGKLSVSAYRQMRDEAGDIVCDTSHFVTYVIDMSLANSEVIAKLLESPDWADIGWIDHDDWVTTARILWLYENHKDFADWFDKTITDYELRNA